MDDTATDVIEAIEELPKHYLHAINQMPEEIWYWASLISIVSSAALFVSNKRAWSIFFGTWSPAFLIFGLFHKVLYPGE